MDQHTTVEVAATAEGRVRIEMSSGAAITASPKGARRLATELEREADKAERIAAEDFMMELAPDDATPQLVEHRKQKLPGAVLIKTMIDNGYLQAGEELRARYPAEGDTASSAAVIVTEDGLLKSSDEVLFNNPSQAAVALLPTIARSANGFSIWKACRAGRGVNLSTIRRRMESGKAPRPITPWPPSTPTAIDLSASDPEERSLAG